MQILSLLFFILAVLRWPRISRTSSAAGSRNQALSNPFSDKTGCCLTIEIPMDSTYEEILAILGLPTKKPRNHPHHLYAPAYTVYMNDEAGPKRRYRDPLTGEVMPEGYVPPTYAEQRANDRALLLSEIIAVPEVELAALRNLAESARKMDLVFVTDGSDIDGRSGNIDAMMDCIEAAKSVQKAFHLLRQLRSELYSEATKRDLGDQSNHMREWRVGTSDLNFAVLEPDISGKANKQ